MDTREVGGKRQWPTGQVLLAHRCRPGAAGTGKGKLEPVLVAINLVVEGATPNRRHRCAGSIDVAWPS